MAVNLNLSLHKGPTDYASFDPEGGYSNKNGASISLINNQIVMNSNSVGDCLLDWKINLNIPTSHPDYINSHIYSREIRIACSSSGYGGGPLGTLDSCQAYVNTKKGTTSGAKNFGAVFTNLDKGTNPNYVRVQSFDNTNVLYLGCKINDSNGFGGGKSYNNIQFIYSGVTIRVEYRYWFKFNTENDSWGTVSSSGKNQTMGTTYDMEINTGVTLTANPKAGYKFKQWSDGNTDRIRTVTINQNYDLIAYFELQPYSITYNLNGGHFSEEDELNKKTQHTIVETVSIPNPTRDYYTFIGWTGTNLSEPTINLTIPSGVGTDNINLIDKKYDANWEPILYSVKCYTDASTLYRDVTYSVENSVSIENPAKLGYEFKGWYGSGIDESSPKKNLTLPQDTIEDKIYYAKWELLTYTINYYDHENSLIYEKNYNVENLYSEEINLEHSHPRSGYKFIGWYGEDISFQDATPRIIISPNKTEGNKNYYARWDIITYEITYQTKNYTEEALQSLITNYNNFPQTYTVAQETITLEEPNRNGYSFLKWEETGTKEAIIPSGSTGEKTFTMVFSPQIKKVSGRTEPEEAGTINFYSVDGTSSPNEKEYEYSDNYIIPKIEAQYNEYDYELKYWTREGSDVQFGIGQKSLTRETLGYLDDYNNYIAHFEKIEYQIEISMIDESSGSYGIYGEILTNNSEDKIEQKNNQIIISNLHFGDERQIFVIPHRSSSSSNKQYLFNKWSNGTSIQSIKVDKSWANQRIQNFDLYFSPIILSNSVNDNSDKNCSKALIEKTIFDLIAIKSINNFGEKSFYNCNNLKFVYAPGVGEIGNEAFLDCNNLGYLVLSSNEEQGIIGQNVFKGCDDLNVLVLPEKYMVLAEGSFCDEDKGIDENKYSLFRKGLGRIYVNPDLVETMYKTNDQWSLYHNIIYPITDLIYIDT